MTALTLARLPVAAGGAVLETTGNLIHWAVGRYMRAPLANSATLAMVTFSAMAGSNALYMQDHAHPAPLFAPVVQRAPAAEVAPVPAVRPKTTLTVLEPLPARETTGSVTPAAETAVKPIGNAEVTEIQRKLSAMQVFDGKVDGLYGPQTARAIRKFEEHMGLPVRGELTHELLEAVRSAPTILPELQSETVPTVEVPAVAPEPAVEMVLPLEAASEEPPTATRPVVVEPLPAPEPLQTAIEAKPVAETPAAETGSTAETARPVLQRELPETPQEAMDIAVKTAGDAIDTIIAGVQSISMTTPPAKRQPRSEQQFVAQSASSLAVVADPDPEPVAAVEPAYEVASVAEPRVGATLVLPEQQETVETEVAVLDTDAKPEDLMPPFSVTDPVIVAKVQRGLASLGFLYGPADGVAGEATAKAIRNFEVYFNYKVTGRISPELLDLLAQNGAAF